MMRMCSVRTSLLFLSVLARSDYMAVVDPWLKEWSKALRVAEDNVLVFRLLQGTLSATTLDGAPVPLLEEHRRELLQAGVFPPEAWQRPVADDVWESRRHLYATSGVESVHIDSACPVTDENHLERTVVRIFRDLRVSVRSILNIGGLYGGTRGEAVDVPDDPTVELLRAHPQAHVLCWACGDVAALSRVGELATRFEHAEVDLLSAELSVPNDYRDLDLLRLDHVPAGQSCRVLSRLLHAGIRPKLVVMLVLSQIPPPFRFAPLSRNTALHPQAFVSCSLSMAGDILAPYGLTLLRLTGPYALFVQRAYWQGHLPLDELDCYRRASVWGFEDFPVAFVREWLFSHVDDALPHVWSNISAVYATSGQPNAPFTLSVA